MDFKKVDWAVGGLVNDNVRKLESVFPSVVKDGEVDFEELKELLGNFNEVGKEKYEMNWVGKKEAKKIALTPLCSKTLKYIEGDGKNEDTTKNLYIEGDNLEVLKLLQNSYYGKVKMIYIDPPYNTGNDFIYNDKFKYDKLFTDILEGNRNENRNLLTKNQKTYSHFHSKWLSMIYSRLLVCKNMLKDDGIIFISIDDNELENLKKVCNEVFGEENFVTQFIWTKTSTPPSLSYKCRKTVEYVVCFEKNKSNNKFFGTFLENGDAPLLNTGNPKKEISFPAGSLKITYIKDGIIKSGKYEKVVLLDDIIVDNNVSINKVRMIGEFKWEQNTVDKEINNGCYFLIKSDKLSIRFQRVDNNNYKTPNNFLNIELNKDTDVLTNESATKELESLNLVNIFDFPKPTSLIKKLISMNCYFDKEAIILDFFSGSSTTAHAVMQLNEEDGGNRKYIMVQLPELTDEKSEAYKAGYKNICEIGKERIRRAGDKILEDNKDKEGIENLDIGFKVFRVENSNIRWQNQLEEDGQIRYDLDGKSIDDIDFVVGTKDIDVVYEILLRHYGIPLTAKTEMLDFIGPRTYAIEDSIIVCLETKITKDIVDKISKLRPLKVIFRDSAFGEDISLKQNSVHRLNLLIEKNNKNTTHVVEFI